MLVLRSDLRDTIFKTMKYGRSVDMEIGQTMPKLVHAGGCVATMVFVDKAARTIEGVGGFFIFGILNRIWVRNGEIL